MRYVYIFSGTSEYISLEVAPKRRQLRKHRMRKVHGIPDIIKSSEKIAQFLFDERVRRNNEIDRRLGL